MLVKVEGTNLYRDTETMALINRDTKEKNDYVMKSRLIKNQKDQINTVKEEMKISIQEEVDFIFRHRNKANSKYITVLSEDTQLHYK